MNEQKTQAMLAAYDAKTAHDGRSNRKSRSMSAETRIILILPIYDRRSARWIQEFLVEQGELDAETDPKKEKSQLRNVSGWVSEVRVQDMKLPPLHKGRVQPPDMAVALQRWYALNPRPSAKMILSGKWQGIAADYSDLDLLPSGHQRIKKVVEVDRTLKTGHKGKAQRTVRTPQPLIEKGTVSPEPHAEKDLRPADLTRMLKKLHVDETYPEKAVQLMTLRHTKSMGKKPSPDDIRDWCPGIARTMKDAGLVWVAPTIS